MDVLQVWAHILFPGITHQEWIAIFVGGWLIPVLLGLTAKAILIHKGWER